MDYLERFAAGAVPWIPFFTTLLIGAVGLMTADWIMFRRTGRRGRSEGMGRTGTMFGLTFVAVILLVLSLPFEDDTKNEMLKLCGLLLTGVIAFSSTTFAGNAMAGLMLRAMGNFSAGDFLQVNGHFGRVSYIGILRTEIQTVDRSLITLPNLYLVNHPVEVTQSSGAVISVEVGLGYDAERHHVEDLLKMAVAKAELTDPFVHITSLGDYAITYLVAGFLKDVKFVVSRRSQLMSAIVDVLHENGIEIASPTLMDQRQYPKEHAFLTRPRRTRASAVEEDQPEALIFDKADEAESLANMRDRLKSIHLLVGRIGADRQKESDPARIAELDSRLEKVQAIRDELAAEIEARTES